MRYVILGAGAVGGTVGGRLALAGRDVVTVARGAHLEAMRAGGLRLRLPDGEHVLRLPVAAGPEEVSLRPGDVLVLAAKSQDTTGLLQAWASAPVQGGGTAGERLLVLCLQNGVANERAALRFFVRVGGVCVWLPSAHLEPGLVVAPCAPLTGILHLGAYPSGVTPALAAVAADLVLSGFGAPLREDVMRWKHGKLLDNLANALAALLEGELETWEHLRLRARAEGAAALAAAGLSRTTGEQEEAERGDRMRRQQVEGFQAGGSTWQSLSRGLAMETDYLNGEIVLLGRLHGVPTPVNAAVQRLAHQAVANGWLPRSVPVDRLAALAADV